MKLQPIKKPEEEELVAIVHTVQKLIVISNKFPRTFDSIFLSYVIDAY